MHKNTQSKIRVGILGAAGFSGVELIHLLANHPGVELIFASSDQKAGQPLSRLVGRTGSTDTSHLCFCPAIEAENLTRSGAVDAVFLATPAEASAQFARKFKEATVRIIDLSGAHRLRDEAQAQAHYKLPANAAAYGLPELFRASIPRDAKLIANPGCYATAAALALAPLLREFSVQTQSLVIHAASGVSGAGRKASEEFSLTALRDDYRAYRVLSHQHEPEIVQTLSDSSGKNLELTFTPHLIPVTRGILVTAHARLEQAVQADAIFESYINQYGSEPFIDLADQADDVRLSAVVGTNRCQIGLTLQDRRIIVCAAIDNLIKGAAGQAVQNFNLLFGFPETESLITLRRYQS